MDYKKCETKRELGVLTGVANSGAHSVAALEEKLDDPRSYESRSTRHTDELPTLAHPPPPLSLSLSPSPHLLHSEMGEKWEVGDSKLKVVGGIRQGGIVE